MPAIVSPQPLRAATSASSGFASLSACSWSPPSRLGSPIKLGSPCLQSPRPSLEPPFPLSEPLHRATQTKRRDYRSRNGACRRRQCAGACPIRSQVHSFDDLPWIAALDVEPAPGFDIADLSQLYVADNMSAAGAGPIRQRKTSPRSNPLGPAAFLSTVHHVRHRNAKTPVPRSSGGYRASGMPQNLSEVQFNNLMPVLGAVVHDSKEGSTPFFSTSMTR